MMYITIYRDAKLEPPIDKSWHVGTPLELASVLFDGNVSVTIQADGDELEYVVHTFKNIPSTPARVQIWHGDIAKFIGANLALMN
jgi:hypothetical protein